MANENALFQVNIDGKAVSNLIDKLSQGIGWLATPKGSHKDREQAVEYLIEEIKKDPHMPPYAKAVKIANARRDIKEYSNQNDIFYMAAEQLDDKSQPESVDDDWLSYFFDHAKNISNEQLKIIWGKLLENECKQPDSMQKGLIHTLSIMDYNSANAFNLVCNFCIRVSVVKNGHSEYDYPLPLIDILGQPDFFKGLNDFNLSELKSLGLINYDVLGYGNKIKRIVGKYFDKIITIESSDNQGIMHGNINLTRMGQNLYKILTAKKVDGYLDCCEKYLKSKGYKIEIFNG